MCIWGCSFPLFLFWCSCILPLTTHFFHLSSKRDGHFPVNFPGLRNNFCVFSTQAIKHLTTGDGGFISCPDAELFRRAKLLRWYGIDRDPSTKSKKDYRIEQDIPEWGYKFHMNNINATIGLSNLPHISKNIAVAKKIASFYLENIRHQDVKMFDYQQPDDCSWWLFSLKVTNDRKESFMDYMASKKIVTSQVHKRNDGHSCLKAFQRNDLKALGQLETQLTCIPIGWWISDKEAKYIVESINSWWEIKPTTNNTNPINTEGNIKIL